MGKLTGSSLHTAFIMAMPSSIRRPRSRNGTPSALNSASIQPTPAPRISRPVRQVLQRREFLGERQRMAHRQHQHAGAKLHALRAGRGPGQRQHRVPEIRRRRIVRVLRDDDVLAHPDIGKAEVLGLHRGATDRVRAGLAADMGQMNADLHDRASSRWSRDPRASRRVASRAGAVDAMTPAAPRFGAERAAISAPWSPHPAGFRS